MTDTSTPNPSDSGDKPPRPRLSLKRNRKTPEDGGRKPEHETRPVPGNEVEGAAANPGPSQSQGAAHGLSLRGRKEPEDEGRKSESETRPKVKLAPKSRDLEEAPTRERPSQAPSDTLSTETTPTPSTDSPLPPVKPAEPPVEPREPTGEQPPPPPKVKPVLSTRAQSPNVADDAPPTHSEEAESPNSGKAPPPANAPGHEGKIRKKRVPIGKVALIALAIALVALGGFYGVGFFQDRPEEGTPAAPVAESPAESEAADGPEPENSPTVAETDSSPRTDPPSDGSEPVASTPPAPEIDPNTSIAAQVDALQISMTRPHSTEPIIVIAGVVYSPGMLIDPESGLRFIGFVPERREIVFEDSRGARYYRYF